MGANNRIEKINHLILEIANGNFDHKLEISDEFDEVDAIVAGINMLGEELKASMIAKNYLKSIFEGIIDMLIIFDEHMFIKEVNHKTIELLGFDESCLIGQPVSSLFPRGEKKLINLIKTKLVKQGFLYNQETSFRQAIGDVLPVSISLSVLKDNHNEEKGFILIAKDLKHVLLTANALKQKNEELKTLVYKVSHDLKGPVASVIGLLNLVDMAGDDLPTIQNYLFHVRSSLDKLNHTIVSLLEYSLSSQPDYEIETIYIKDLLIEVIQSYASFPGRNQVTIQLEATEDLIIKTGRKLLTSIFQHLIENAITYRAPFKKHALLKITTYRQGKNILFTFKDNGCGMESQVAARAFDMFYRGTQTSKGSGLGLFIAKTNIERLGGEISLSSKTGLGTEVRLHLPSLTENTISISK
ncbi:sensor histidine kinase [Catalinimonas niigatensis]|uniref:sensor histidine kinase n=1 Tax=Catalinimonas niigatensis TaxID=1397264 RepID=UPI002666B15B|nr:PAS domain-containing sensor histidine kinase [Catalinimonas niigatensis]WPP51524.1 PAS domain-containing sensor histidine kinase [Catalinimonas niigatensis]